MIAMPTSGTSERKSGDHDAGAPHVLVLGAGFGGLTAAQALAKAPVRVTLIDRTNHHTFQPLLYQVAMAGLSPADIAQPIRTIVRGQKNVTVLLATAVRFDLDAKQTWLEDGAVVSWDYLVVACGAETSYFGHDEWRTTAAGLKSLEDAVSIRQRVLLSFELAEREENADRRDELLTFTVIGGGPTGVELAGALAELSRSVLARDFRHINSAAAKVYLLEAGPRILPALSEDLSRSAVRQLEQLGVHVRTNARVTAIEPGSVHLGTERIGCEVVLWAAGVRANPITAALGVPIDKAGRVLVERDLSVPEHPHVFVIGDAALLNGTDGKPLPGVSPVAMQQARTVARSIRRMAAGGSSVAFHYRDKGSLATIGRSRAVAMMNHVHLSGFVAWLAWLTVHIFYLIGFKNRIVVLITWAWSYVTYRRGARLITEYPGTREIERQLTDRGGKPRALPDKAAASPHATREVTQVDGGAPRRR